MPRLRSPRASSRWLRLALAAYFSAGLLFGLLRLAGARWDFAEMGPVLTLWYVEALAFLAVWGFAAAAKGLFSGRAERSGRGPVDGRDDLLRTTLLTGLERRRGR